MPMKLSEFTFSVVTDEHEAFALALFLNAAMSRGHEMSGTTGVHAARTVHAAYTELRRLQAAERTKTEAK